VPAEFCPRHHIFEIVAAQVAAPALTGSCANVGNDNGISNGGGGNEDEGIDGGYKWEALIAEWRQCAAPIRAAFAEMKADGACVCVRARESKNYVLLFCIIFILFSCA
jgi:hypothetical protein